MSPIIRRRAGHLAAFERLSIAQREAILVMFFAIPRHQSCLLTYGVRVGTLSSLAKCGLARRTWLFAEGVTKPMPFWTLTQRGFELERAARDGGH